MALRTDFTATQKRALAVATALAIVLGAYFLRSYLMVVVVAAVAAYTSTRCTGGSVGGAAMACR